MRRKDRCQGGFALPFWTGAAAFLVIVVAASGACCLDKEPDGYGGIAWGTRVAEVEGMVLARPSMERGEMAVYRRLPEVLQYGGATLEAVEYEFWKGRLARVALRVKDLYNFILLRDLVFSRYGKGREISPQAERYVWEGRTTRMTLLSNFDIS